MKVRLSTHLRSYTGRKGEVEASGATLAEAMRDLDQHYPGLRFRVIDEQDHIRDTIKIYVNSNIMNGLNVPVNPTDTIHIIGALSGGLV